MSVQGQAVLDNGSDLRRLVTQTSIPAIHSYYSTLLQHHLLFLTIFHQSKGNRCWCVCGDPKDRDVSHLQNRDVSHLAGPPDLRYPRIPTVWRRCTHRYNLLIRFGSLYRILTWFFSSDFQDYNCSQTVAKRIWNSPHAWFVQRVTPSKPNSKIG